MRSPIPPNKQEAPTKVSRVNTNSELDSLRVNKERKFYWDAQLAAKRLQDYFDKSFELPLRNLRKGNIYALCYHFFLRTGRYSHISKVIEHG
jgi:hypothetical protein